MGVNFNTQAAVTMFVGQKISRYTGDFLDKLGPETLKGFITTGQLLTDYIPDDKKQELKMAANPHLRIIATLAPEVAYTWLPDRHIAFIESFPNGYDWAINQLKVIKQYLVS